MGIDDQKGCVLSVNVSSAKGERKKCTQEAHLKADHGIDGDAHAGPGVRQVSLLAKESIAKMRARGLDVGPGDFAENITTQGIDLTALKTGDIILIGDSVRFEITQIGKVCHDRCEIYRLAGDCVMPREGIFARVLDGGILKPGDSIGVVKP